MNYDRTEQERFWESEFGDRYNERRSGEDFYNSKLVMFGRMLRGLPDVKSAREFGCNIGLNLRAINTLNNSIELSGVEINVDAYKKAKQLGIAEIHNQTICEKLDLPKVDLTFTAAVLIHINPNQLDSVYSNLYEQSNKYILIQEYYNPTPVTVNYRGHDERLFKRDFAGDLIDKYNMKLRDYGFVYKRDTIAPQDDLTWFLLEK